MNGGFYISIFSTSNKAAYETICFIYREAALRPAAGSMIPEIFTPSLRGTANGIFSWGIYWGYGLTFTLGNYLAPLDLLG